VRPQTPQSRRLALLDSYDMFQQKGTVTDHSLRFDRLCMHLEHVGVTQVDAFTASKYFRSLRPDLTNRVGLKYSELPDTLEAVHAAALVAEYAITNQSIKPPAPHPIKLQQLIHLEPHLAPRTSAANCTTRPGQRRCSMPCTPSCT
jgi:hypothetical protein